MRTSFFTGFIAISLLLFSPSVVAASGHLARGAVPGELYVHGVGGYYPDWIVWLYRSTDYGQTVTIQNTTELIGKLGEGVAVGELYYAYPNHIYYSDDFGVTFLQKEFLADLMAIASGYATGEVYAYKYNSMKYSTDYGETFNDKGTCPGQVTCMSVGHNPGEIFCGCFAGEV